ncbi:MAG: helix-turn-helix domain-containing protein [Bacteroidales bacterium]|nr:helix-turn-helix domain-containing protein [Bacteroidales bacterium]
MKLDELILLFPSRNAIADQALMIGPADLRRLEGREISGSRMFLIVLAGCIEVRIDGTPSVLCPNSFVDMFEKTTFFVERIAPDCEAYCFLPTKEFVRDALMSFRVGDDRHLFNSMKFPVLRIPADDARILERPLKLLSDSVLNTANHYRTELVQVYFRAFLIEFSDILFRLSGSSYEESAPFTRKDGLFMDFMKLVWQHACRERRIDFYADQLSITPKHLTRIIRERLSTTPHEVIAKEVIHHAIEMLRQEDFSIQQIASRLNFPDQASFCKFFKTHLTLSPTEYRKKVCTMT